MSNNRYYYLNKEGKIIAHYGTKQEIEPQGFEFVGMSQLPIRTAAASYVRNQPGHKLLDGDKIEAKTEEQPEPVVETITEPGEE